MCHAMISPNTRRCPQCGEPSPHATNTQKLIGLGIVLVMAAGWFAWIQHVASQHP